MQPGTSRTQTGNRPRKSAKVDANTQVFGILLILLTLVLSVIATQQMRRRGTVPLRVIPAYATLPDTIGLAIESNRPLHLALGSTALGGQTTLLSLAAAEYFYQVAARAAISDLAPIVTLSDGMALPLAQDTLRRAYLARGRANRYRFTNARWYPSGARSMVYAAAISALIGDTRPSANLFAGEFGPELGLMMETGARRDVPGIAVSGQLEGQAVAYAFSEHLLIGEEVFAAGAYLGGGAGQIAETLTLDILRWLLVFGLIGAALFGLFTRGG